MLPGSGKGGLNRTRLAFTWKPCHNEPQSLGERVMPLLRRNFFRRRLVLELRR